MQICLKNENSVVSMDLMVVDVGYIQRGILMMRKGYFQKPKSGGGGVTGVEPFVEVGHTSSNKKNWANSSFDLHVVWKDQADKAVGAAAVVVAGVVVAGLMSVAYVVVEATVGEHNRHRQATN